MWLFIDSEGRKKNKTPGAKFTISSPVCVCGGCSYRSDTPLVSVSLSDTVVKWTVMNCRLINIADNISTISKTNLGVLHSTVRIHTDDHHTPTL